MKFDYLSHDELQHIEHANKILKDHQELIKTVTNETEALLNNYIPIIKSYVNAIHDIQTEFSHSVSDVVKSSRELKVITSGANEVLSFVQAVERLKSVLNDEFTQKVIELTKR